MLEPVAVETAPVPFASLGLDPRLLEGVRDLGFSETRPIQSAVITLSLAGDDLIACAETGSGKTCAFVIPMLQRLLREGVAPQDAPKKSRVLVLAPTRELAVQIEDEIREVGVADAVAIPPGARHQIKNNGSIDLVFLCCCAPSYENDDTVMVEALL